MKERTWSNKAVGTVSLPLSDKAVGAVRRKDNYKIIVLTADSKYNNPHPYKSYNLVDSVIGKPDGQLQNPHKKLNYLHLIRPTRIFEPRLEPKGLSQRVTVKRAESKGQAQRCSVKAKGVRRQSSEKAFSSMYSSG